MRTVSRPDLLGVYQWDTDEPTESALLATSDSAPFDRRNGYAVLHFLNRFALKHGLDVPGTLVAERGVQAAPEHLQSRLQLMHWIEINWQSL